jgi:uncharacterized protein YuzE
MLRELQRFEDGYKAKYLRFSNHKVAKTLSFHDGGVNVDLDGDGEVIGIEVLCLDSVDLRTIADLLERYNLSLNRLIDATRRKSA